MRTAQAPRFFGRPVRSVHCLGVGGAGMAPLAIYLSELGLQVSGEDDDLAPEVREFLVRAGVALGPLPDGAEMAAYSSAISPAHPVYAAAARRRLPLVRRGEMLAEALRERRLVAVCGAHGKSTTTAMLITALRQANFPAGYLLGGLFKDGLPPARIGSNEWVVAEIDESDGTIEHFNPEITVAVNLDWDHPDYYRDPSQLESTFAALFARTRAAVLISDMCSRSLSVSAKVGPDRRAGRACPEVVPARPAVGPCDEGGSAATFTFGRSGDYSYEIVEEADGRMRLRLGGRFPAGEALVGAQGEFNAANAAAALAAAWLMGLEPGPRALADYAGVRRRQAVLSTDGGITVMEDYAHHPTEIRALLSSLRRRMAEGGRLLVVFQPHRFSRTARFKAEFAAALALADRVHLLDVYPAGEAPVAGGTTADIYAEMKRAAGPREVEYLPGGGPELFRSLGRVARRGDWIAFVGAGDVDRQARKWLEERQALAERSRRWDEFAEVLRPRLSPAAKLRRDEPLGRKTTLGVGGPARLYAEPAGVEDMREIVRAAEKGGLPWLLLGRGSNLLVPDTGVEAVVVSLAQEAWAKFEPRPDGRVWVGAGLRLKNLCGLATRAGLTGFEFLEGIPGTVGGALRMNAGAMGGWMFDLVEEIEIMGPDGNPARLRRADMHVEYRHCAELHHAAALGALLRPATPGASEAISRQIDVYRRKRHESQPREPSAGCIFKNPPGDSAGRLIDASGLKGERVGDAEVSPVHANFIVNRGHASSADVLQLIRQVRERVRRLHGVELQPEVLLFGEKWEDHL